MLELRQLGLPALRQVYDWNNGDAQGWDFEEWFRQASASNWIHYGVERLPDVPQADFNATVPGAPRAGEVASLRVVRTDMQSVFCGLRAVASMHADSIRGGLKYFRKVMPELTGRAADANLRTVHFYQPSSSLGETEDLIVYDYSAVSSILQKHCIADLPHEFLLRSLRVVFPLGSDDRNAIDEMYAESSQPVTIGCISLEKLNSETASIHLAFAPDAITTAELRPLLVSIGKTMFNHGIQQIEAAAGQHKGAAAIAQRCGLYPLRDDGGSIVYGMKASDYYNDPAKWDNLQ